MKKIRFALFVASLAVIYNVNRVIGFVEGFIYGFKKSYNTKNI